MEETKKKGSGTTDLTVGLPLTRILQFALPLVLGTLFQQLYSFVDTIIVGSGRRRSSSRGWTSHRG